MIRSSFLAGLCVSITAFLCAGETPTVTLIAPAANASFTLPTTLSVAANATVSGGTIAKVEFLNGTVKIGETTTSPYTFAWTPAVPGVAQLTARATNDTGDTGTSVSVPVTLLPGLPYHAGFEASEGYAPGSLNNQQGWKVASGDAQVISGIAAQGAQYVTFTPGASAAVVNQEFGSAASSPAVAYVDFYTQPVMGADIATGTLFDLDAVRLTCVLNGITGQLQALDGDGLGAGTWRALAPALALDANNVATTWQRFTVRLNYTAQTYDLYLNGAMIAADLKFRVSVTPYVSWFSVKGHTAASATLDNLYAGAANPLFADANNNGIDDAWETAHGLSLSSDNRSTDDDGDGLTNLQEYISGSDPRDYFNGVLPVITSLVNSSGMPGMNGLVSVKITRSSDGFVLMNAPVTLTVTTGASQIASVAGGTLMGQISVRTDSSGIAVGYVTFNAQSADTLLATTTSGSQTATLSIALNPPLLPPPSAGMRLWLKADSLNLANGAAVSTWPDMSGAGNSAVQTISANCPALVTNALNGRPVVRFDGSKQQKFNLPDVMNGATQGEIFAVVRSTVTPGALWSFGGYGQTYPYYGGAIYEGFGTTTWAPVPTPLQDLAQYHLYSVSASETRWTQRIDGAINYDRTGNSVSFTNSPTLGTGDGFFLTGDIAEVIVYESVLTTQARVSVEAYLNSKYALIAPPAAPEAPTNLNATPLSATQVSLSWRATKSSNQTTYVIDRSTDGLNFTQVGSIVNILGWADTGLVEGTAYTYRVKAQNSSGTSGYSNLSTAFTFLGGTEMPLFTAQGMRLWLKADSAIQSDDTAVTTWTDDSGLGNDASQSIGLNKPALVAHALNGRPVVRFDGNDDGLALPDFMNANAGKPAAAAGEVFVVWKSDKNTDGSSRNNGMWQLGASSSDYYPYSGAIYDGFGSTERKSAGMPNQDIGQYHLYNVLSQPGLWVNRINGQLQYCSTTNIVGWSATPGLSNTSVRFRGDIAEILIYDRALDSAEREAVGRYLANKYALFPVPAAPSNFVATALSGTQISLAWTPPTPDRKDLLIYEIERKTGSTGTYSKIGETTSLGYLDDGLPTSTSYTYRVRARSLSGAGGYSDETMGTTLTAGSTNLPIANLRLWLMGDNLPAAGSVNVWPDQSGLGNDATQGALSQQPTLVANVLNGRPVVHFDGNDDGLALPNFMNANAGKPVAAAGEVFVVWKADKNADGSTRNNRMWQLGASNSDYYPYSNGEIYDGFGSTERKSAGLPNQDITRYHLYNVTSQPGEWVNRINGQIQYRSTTNTVGWTTTPGLSNAGECFRGDIAELLIYDRVLTSTEREAVGRYLGLKYALYTVPMAPTNLVAAAVSGTQISLAWTPPLPARSDLLVYEVERKSEMGVYAKVAETTALGYLDDGLTALTGYIYRIRARSLSGTSDYSAEVSLTTFGGSATSMPFTGLRLWLRADNLPAAGNVNVWPDQSGLSNDAMQFTLSQQPTLVANALNGRPVVRFDGNDDRLTLPDFMNANAGKTPAQTAATAGEVIVVWKADSGRSNRMWQLGASNNDYYPYSNGEIYDGFGSTERKSAGLPNQDITRYHLYNVTSQPGEWVNRINGQIQYRNTTNTVGWTTTPGLSNAGECFRGDIAELLIYDRVLTSTEREAVGRYLNRKYSLGLAQVFGDTGDSNADGLSDIQDVLLGIDPYSMDVDGDGIQNQIERANGTDPLNADTDHDGVPDNLDAFPLDPTRWAAPVADPNDHTGPTVTLTKPAQATLN